MSATQPRSKTVAAWLAIALGTFGLHRFYLYGLRDWVGWLYPWPALAGIAGALRMRSFGQDDVLSWLLIPLLGLTISAAMLSAIVYGLTNDETWAARHGDPAAPRRTGWLPVLAVIAALLIGATALMSTLAFTGQKLFEWQARTG